MPVSCSCLQLKGAAKLSDLEAGRTSSAMAVTGTSRFIQRAWGDGSTIQRRSKHEDISVRMPESQTILQESLESSHMRLGRPCFMQPLGELKIDKSFIFRPRRIQGDWARPVR